MSYMAPLGLAHAAVTKAIASGDLDAANAVYQKFAHLAPLDPGFAALGDKIAEQSLGVKQNQKIAQVLRNGQAVAADPDIEQIATLAEAGHKVSLADIHAVNEFKLKQQHQIKMSDGSTA